MFTIFFMIPIQSPVEAIYFRVHEAYIELERQLFCSSSWDDQHDGV